VRPSIAAFDGVASGYDRAFTDTPLGRELRAIVWDCMLDLFPARSRLLELNCGTGEDAAFLAARGFHVTATDGSPAMVEQARRKAECRGLEGQIRHRTLDLDDLGGRGGPFPAESFDGAFSNFGGLNCVVDRAPLAAALARWLRPEAPILLVVMGRLCLWETTASLARGRYRQAFRRLTGGPTLARVGGEDLTIVYPWPSELARSFTPWFRLEWVEGLGVTLPPSVPGTSLERRPRLFRALAAFEGIARKRWPFRLLGDHYIAVLRRNV
jgi:SAM-dependent methyltransferase